MRNLLRTLALVCLAALGGVAPASATKTPYTLQSIGSTGGAATILPGATVTIYLAGGTTKANLYDALGAVIANPLRADSNGLGTFWADNSGTYYAVWSLGLYTSPPIYFPTNYGSTIAARLTDETYVTDLGVDKTGNAGVSSAINAALGTTRRLFFPCGTYLIDAPILIPSTTEIRGAGACTILKISATLATDTSTPFGTLRHVLTNNDYAAGNVDVYVHDLTIDGTSGPTSGVHIHAIGFYKLTRGGVWNLTIKSGAGLLMDDGIAFVASKEYFVRNNKIYGTINACIDQWEGVTDFDVSGNICDGLNLANYGILVSGFGTNGAPFTSQRGSISGNVVKNFPGVGIWLQGGWNGVSGGGATYGLVKNIEVVGNNISGVNGYHGIDLTDASNNSIVANTLENIGRNAVVVSSENSGASTNNVIATNAISSCNAAASGDACILLTPYAHYNTLSDNTIAGTAQPYSIVINGGATGNVIRGGVTPVGTIGDVSDGGTATQLQIGNAFVTSPTFRSLTGYVKGNGASAATASATVPTTDLSGVLQAAQEPAHTGDVTNSVGSLALTLATVNSNVGTYGTATQVPQITVNAKGLATAVANVTITPALSSITGLGTGAATALANPVDASGGMLTYASIGTSGAKVPLLNTANTWALAQVFSAGASSSTFLLAGGASYMGFNARSLFDSPSDGVLRVSNWAQTDFNRLQLGGTTASFPAIKRSAATLAFRLADDSADAAISAAAVTASGKVSGPAATTSLASFNAPHGTAPSSPTNGDIWTTTAGLYARINGATTGPFAAPGSNVCALSGLSECAFAVRNLNLNATGDTAIPITLPAGATRYAVFAIRVSNSTGTLPNGTGTLGAYTGAGRTGVTIASQQALNTIITSQADATLNNAGPMTIAVGAQQSFTATTLYLNVQTAQGATSAIDVAIVLRYF